MFSVPSVVEKIIHVTKNETIETHHQTIDADDIPRLLFTITLAN
ncbi:hypothetical protein ACFL27_01940 [candidate division CSSED10-310 bacterium]|uniref:Uncharacterized protein n=1 Tax=candidate division CSSED10-310 bacterium TaxID=2855610 RepID=A0ABV6YRW2_UNCC1